MSATPRRLEWDQPAPGDAIDDFLAGWDDDDAEQSESE